ncbi:MAG: class I SAM-dependent methyltransferase [Candidatus Diapherotrites archaeon]|nr:class I SAM-dependent methyltransferase [Candidatus Diapherotrites archaeon]
MPVKKRRKQRVLKKPVPEYWYAEPTFSSRFKGKGYEKKLTKTEYLKQKEKHKEFTEEFKKRHPLVNEERAWAIWEKERRREMRVREPGFAQRVFGRSFATPVQRVRAWFKLRKSHKKIAKEMEKLVPGAKTIGPDFYAYLAQTKFVELTSRGTGTELVQEGYEHLPGVVGERSEEDKIKFELCMLLKKDRLFDKGYFKPVEREMGRLYGAYIVRRGFPTFMASKLLEGAPRKKGSKVVVLGFGGTGLGYLSKKPDPHRKFVLVDNSPTIAEAAKTLKELRNLKNVTVLEKDATTTVVHDADHIDAQLIFEYLDWGQREELIQNAAKSLKKDGTMFITDKSFRMGVSGVEEYSPWGYMLPKRDEKKELASVRKVVKLLKKHGFKATHEYKGRLYRIKAKKK